MKNRANLQRLHMPGWQLWGGLEKTKLYKTENLSEIATDRGRLRMNTRHVWFYKAIVLFYIILR